MWKDDLHVGPSLLAKTTGVIAAPWIIKPLWGMISDCFPLFGYRRKSYIILWGIVSFLCW